jgi:hypothetical protein
MDPGDGSGMKKRSQMKLEREEKDDEKKEQRQRDIKKWLSDRWGRFQHEHKAPVDQSARQKRRD